MPANIQHGYLVLADISGYTSYLSSVELDHAHEILTDLLRTVVERLEVLLTVAKLEGDAVFAYAPEARVPRGEALLELIESTYVAFRDRVGVARHLTTCECKACRATPSLDLKFIVHHGDFVLQQVGRITELAGSDVNLVHRLLKNHLAEATGWKAYALFTETGLAHMGVRPADLHEQTETYEHLGAVQTLSLNLHPRYAELIEARRAFIPPEAAHVQLAMDFAAPRQTVWEWFNDPRKRSRWMHSRIVPVARAGGRNGPGARNHCVHGRDEVVVEDVLDVRPFDYFTVAHTPRGTSASLWMTFQFAPTPQGGTRLQLTFQGKVARLPDWAGRLLCHLVVQYDLRRRWAFDQIDTLIAAEAAAG